MESVSDIIPINVQPADMVTRDRFLDKLAETLVALQRATSVVRLAIGTWLLEAHAHFAPDMAFQRFCHEVSGELAERGVSYNGETLRAWAYIAKDRRLSELAEEHGVSVVLSSLKRGEEREDTALRVEAAVAVAGERGTNKAEAARTLARLPWTESFGIPKLRQIVDTVTIVRSDGRKATQQLILVVSEDEGGQGVAAFVTIPSNETPGSRGAGVLLERARIYP